MGLGPRRGRRKIGQFCAYFASGIDRRQLPAAGKRHPPVVRIVAESAAKTRVNPEDRLAT
jgi:hypothetical protein